MKTLHGYGSQDGHPRFSALVAMNVLSCRAHIHDDKEEGGTAERFDTERVDAFLRT
jgi:hypothetical protein